MSSSKRLKCANCNIVICEVLAFIQNKLDVMDEESLVRICESAFSVEDIEEAESLLFESLQKTAKTRKRQGKTQRNLDDIIVLFKGTDPEKIPKFVAKDLEKLPPVTFDHIDVTPVLKKILMLQKSIEDIQQNYVTKMELQHNYCHKLPSYDEKRNINTKRGTNSQNINNMINSGPMALSMYEETVGSNTETPVKEVTFTNNNNGLCLALSPINVNKPASSSTSHTSIKDCSGVKGALAKQTCYVTFRSGEETSASETADAGIVLQTDHEQRTSNESLRNIDNIQRSEAPVARKLSFVAKLLNMAMTGRMIIRMRIGF